MPTIDIKISQLNSLTTISSSDFFPIVQSSSATTFKTNIQSLNNWFSVSGSASYAPTNISYWTTSSNSANNISNFNSGFVGIHQNSPIYQLDVNGNIGNSAGTLMLYGTASISTTSSYSITASNAITASYIKTSSYALSASYSITASNAVTASYSNTSSYAVTASNAITASLAATASYIPPSSTFIKAFAMATGSDSSKRSNPAYPLHVVSGYNISSIVPVGGIQAGVRTGQLQYGYGITFTSPLSSTNYIVMGTQWEEAAAYGNETGEISLPTNPIILNARTIYGFTASMQTDADGTGAGGGTPAETWCMNFQVLGT